MSLTFGRRYSNGPLGSRGSGCSGATEDVIDQYEELWMAKTRLVLMVLSEKPQDLDVELSADSYWFLIYDSLIVIWLCLFY